MAPLSWTNEREVRYKMENPELIRAMQEYDAYLEGCFARIKHHEEIETAQSIIREIKFEELKSFYPEPEKSAPENENKADSESEE